MKREYHDLHSILPADNIAWDNFDFNEYFSGERKYLKPALEALGYTNVRFLMGERDSFGPLSRIVVVCAPDSKDTFYVYG